MCLIITKKKEQQLSQEFITSVYRRNSDGWGIMWYNRKGKPSVVKGLDLFGFNKWYNKLKRKELIIHFRMRTDGKINVDNAHPYEVVDGVYMMHNGILSAYRTDRNADISDTKNFIIKEVRPLLEAEGAEYVHTAEFIKKMEKFTSRSNKLAFITPEKFIVIEPQFWERTTSGLLVSNSYAYEVDNPSHYGYGYSTPTVNHSFKPGEGKYGSYSNHRSTTNYPPRRDWEEEWPYGARQHSYTPTPSPAPLPSAADNIKLIADNTKTPLLDSTGEPIITAKSKKIHEMTDEEFRELENDSEFRWLERLSIDELVAFMGSAPETIAHSIQSMLATINEGAAFQYGS